MNRRHSRAKKAQQSASDEANSLQQLNAQSPDGGHGGGDDAAIASGAPYTDRKEGEHGYYAPGTETTQKDLHEAPVDGEVKELDSSSAPVELPGSDVQPNGPDMRRRV